jgi:hypothetical protein
MPILLNILGNIPEELLQLADENPVPKFNQLPPLYQHVIIEMNNQLIELYTTIARDFPKHSGHLSTILAEAMSPAEYDQLSRVITKLYAAHWLDNTKSTSSLHLLNMALTKRNNIKKNEELDLAAEKTRLEAKLEQETDKHRRKIDKEIAEIDQMITASETLKQNMSLNAMFEGVTDDLLERVSEDPQPMLSELTPEQQAILTLLGNRLVTLAQQIPALVKISVNADSLMMIMAESLSASELDPVEKKINKLFDTPWLGKGIGIEYAALTNLMTSFMLRNEIRKKTQKSLQEEKAMLENKLHQPTKFNEQIKSLHTSLIKIRDMSEVAQLMQQMEVLPSSLKGQPQNKIIARFEEKLKMKIASLDQDIREENPEEKNYDDFKLNKQSKIAHLQSMLKQIVLYRFNAISLDDLIERVQSFQQVAEHLSHTNSFKIFVNKHIDDFFTVDTKKVLDDFHKEMVAYKSGLPLKK